MPHSIGMSALRQLIVLLPTFDMELSSPVFVYADTVKYQVPALRFVIVYVKVLGLAMSTVLLSEVALVP